MHDARIPREYVDRGTIPGAVNIPHGEIAQRIAELDPVEPTVVFRNGPQCTATAQATDALLAAGWPAERLLYDRGGIDDWVKLGLPLAPPASWNGTRGQDRCGPDTSQPHRPEAAGGV